MHEIRIGKMQFRTLETGFTTMLFGMLLLLSSCRETGPIGEYQSITQLYDSCPGNCGEQLPCEGQLVKVWGYLDEHNIFDKSQSDHETERFLIAEQLDNQGFASGKRIEVYPPQNRDNAVLFGKFNGVDVSSRILVAGTVKGFDAPTNLSCQRLISLEIQGEGNVIIE
jgi:hypothetical protein